MILQNILATVNHISVLRHKFSNVRWPQPTLHELFSPIFNKCQLS